MSERKYNPIYEALDCYNNKTALTHCQKILKKDPNDALANALKAVALDRSGRAEEALIACERSIKAYSLCAACLEASSSRVDARRSVHSDAEIAAMYEAAVEQQPDNEEFHSHIFMAHVRAQNPRAQQATALRASKRFRNDRYLFWTIMSLVWQAAPEAVSSQKNNDAPALPFSPLVLAERMLDKAVADKRMGSSEELKLHIIVLKMQKKYQHALDILRGEWGGRLKVAAEREKMCIELRPHLQLWDEQVSGAKFLLNEECDDWDAYVALLDALAGKHGESIPKEAVTEVRELIEKYVASESASATPKRGPFLALLELHMRTGSGVEDLVPLLESYFRRFGTKLCCFDDMRPYLKALVPNDIRQRLVEIFKETAASLCNDSTDKGRQESVIRGVFIAKVERFLCVIPQSDTDAILAYGNQLWSKYTEALNLGSHLLHTDRQFGDDYITLLVHLLMDCHDLEGKDQKFLYQAILALEYGLERSKSNFQFKLLLVRLYIKLGAFTRARIVYGTLDIKQIQHDSLGHFALDYGVTLGHVDEALAMLNKANTIYMNNVREVPEMICTAYKFETYSKVLEFLRFYHMLDRSIQRVINDIEHVCGRLAQVIDESRNVSQFLVAAEGLSLELPRGVQMDNRDRSVISNWDGITKVAVEERIRCENIRGSPWIELRGVLTSLFSSRVTSTDIASRLEALNAVDDFDPVDATLLTILRQLWSLCDNNVTASHTAEVTCALKDVLSKINRETSTLPIYEWCRAQRTFLEAVSVSIVVIHRLIQRASDTNTKQVAQLFVKNDLLAVLTDNENSIAEMLSAVKTWKAQSDHFGVSKLAFVEEIGATPANGVFAQLADDWAKAVLHYSGQTSQLKSFLN